MTPADRSTDRIIKQAREYMGYSREDIAGNLGISPDDLDAIEAGAVPPTDAQLGKLSRLYRRAPADLLGPGPDDVSWGPKHTSLQGMAKGLPVDDQMELSMFVRMLRFRNGEATE